MTDNCWVCSYSRKQQLSVHHVTPRSLGGNDIHWNLCKLCFYCHSLCHSAFTPEFLREKVKRVKQGSARHRRLLKMLDRLERAEFYVKIIRFRTVISLVEKGERPKAAVTSQFPTEVEHGFNTPL